jgi:hypothetical protein
MMTEQIPEDLVLEDVSSLRLATDNFVAQARAATDPKERDMLLGYARFYREMAAWSERSEKDDEP